MLSPRIYGGRGVVNIKFSIFFLLHFVFFFSRSSFISCVLTDACHLRRDVERRKPELLEGGNILKKWPEKWLAVKIKTIHAPSHQANGIDGSDQSVWAATSKASSSSAIERCPSVFWSATSNVSSQLFNYLQHSMMKKCGMSPEHTSF
jgi:hypothetical protein